MARAALSTPTFFFRLACAHSALVIALWPASLARLMDEAWVLRLHQDELLLGTFPAVMAGFTLTAMRRWTGNPVTPNPVPALLAVWTAGRAVALFAPWGSAAAAAFPLLLGAVLLRHVLRHGDVRNLPLVTIIGCIGVAGLGRAFLPDAASALLRIVVALTVALLLIASSRIVPALGRSFIGRESRRVGLAGETAAAMASVAVLLVWALRPRGPDTALAVGLLAVFQAVRIGSWNVWGMARHPRFLAVLAGALALPAGLAVLSAEAVANATVGAVGIHVLLVGGLGLSSLAIMTSMVRKRAGDALRWSRSEAILYATLCLAWPLRIFADGSATMLAAASLAWGIAFAGFALLFGRLGDASSGA
ncbi:NnrS family protein [Alsobacter sp. SYSU M60028]|uniref:NnrS family protein n=1 Tax=Alsobacter ponti TaxID=2962936 RepID=A0ABT1L8Z1_9HYPH|nr:NnrS family protein [Alsobacter ponti]MCP8937403.1 NnrS family protein [Alsobacter ponti]